jgi:tRNA(Ile)-lysidine synthase
MIRIIGKIPSNVILACSGGLDSMTIARFLQEGRRKVRLAYFNHDTLHSQVAQEFVEEYAEKHGHDLFIGKVKGAKGKRSMEEFWRDERYNFFSRLESNFIITCHHLDDCVETWIMSSLHGKSKLIPYHRAPNLHRPFLMTSRKVLRGYANRKGVEWVEDPSNARLEYMRNHVRHAMMPHVLKINPGIRTMVRKKIIETYL